MSNTTEFPEGVNFLQLAQLAELKCFSETEKSMKKEDRDLIEEMGTALSLLYRFATCYWGCRKNGHLWESLAGRILNSTQSAIRLISIGYYDEAFALIRTIAELANLFCLFHLSPEEFQNWISEPDEKKHFYRFRPKSVRAKIEAANMPAPVDEDLYSWLCSVGVHANPSTRPQTHNDESRSHVGAVFQPDGHTKAVSTLAWCFWITFAIIRNQADVNRIHWQQMDDSVQRLSHLLETHSATGSHWYRKPQKSND